MPLFFLAAGVTLIFLTLSGRLHAFTDAVTGNTTAASPASPSGGGIPSPTASTYTQGAAPGAYFPSPSLFGSWSPTGQVDATSMLAVDSSIQGFTSPAVGDFDFLFPAGVSNPVSLPGSPSQNYRLLWKVDPPGNGVNGIQVWQTPNGGIMAFLHLLNTGTFAVGQELPGGAQVGMSGWPLSSQYGLGGSAGPSNAHLAVIVDQTALNWLYSVDQSGPQLSGPVTGT